MEPLFLEVVNWKERIFRWRLKRMQAPERERRGCSLNQAESVGLLYLERDHAHFREIKDLAKRIKEEYGVKRVGMMSFVQEEEKQTPNWLVKKLDSGYFCKSDLNWYGWPVKEFEAFTQTPFDILIDLELEPIMPLKFVVRSSCAGMKVGPDHPEWANDLDVRLVQEPEEIDDMEEVDLILHDPMEAWREHTSRTLAFLNQTQLQ
ncbi:MAG: hypothetical protein RLZZ314_629 [Bacteroidota bacterium]|jgi:hypothetical protein|nr:hypothetical protein [Bacteroidota bacterium]